MKIKSLFSFILFVAVVSAVPPSAYAAETPAAAPAPLRILLVAGGCCHDYINQPALLKKGLEERANVKVDIFTSANGTSTTHEIYQTTNWARNYDLVIHDECSADVTNLTTIGNVLMPHAEGLPAVMLHCAMHNFRTAGWNAGTVTPWFELTGLQTTGHGSQRPIAISFIDKESEITKGLENWTTINEELYNNTSGGLLPTAHALAMGKQGTTETVVIWTSLYKQKARVFGTTLGHNNGTVEDPRYLDLVTRGALWAADKLNGTYLKPAPAAAPKGASLPTPSTTEEAAGMEPQGCGCEGDLALVD